jgi:hypothetical protein
VYEGTAKCHVIETDNKCTLDTNGNCIKRDSATLNYERCEFRINNIDSTKYFCKANPLSCDLTTDKAECNARPETENGQCHYFGTICLLIKVDEYCYINSEDKCVERSPGKLKSNEICVYNRNKFTCFKKEKQCSDFTDATCGNFTPDTKLCLNFNENGNGYCKEVQIDNRCSINENNECIGNSCTFDENRDKCYYKENSKGNNKGNEGSFMKLKEFMLLVLFFIF